MSEQPRAEVPGEAAAIIESYLDDLQRNLTGPPSVTRRVVHEAEDHLYESTANNLATGASPPHAAANAIAAFGTPATHAKQFRASTLQSVAVLFRPDTLRSLVAAGVLLIGVGLTAVGVSGLVAQLFGLAFGVPFVSGDYNGVTYTAQRCAEFQSFFPDAGNCEQAAALHHYSEVVDQRVIVGVLGLLILVVYMVWSRRHPASRPPLMLVAAVGCSLFGVAALVQLLAAVAPIIGGGQGLGDPLAGAIVSMAVAIAFVPLLGRSFAARGGVG